jgi:bisphosphoglycerate-independent phosphoglycerate mutase (AlkP superfamily)
LFNREKFRHISKHPKCEVFFQLTTIDKTRRILIVGWRAAEEIADMLIEGVEAGVRDVFANFANADMVAHAMTDAQRFDDVVRGLLALDAALERVVDKALRAGYVVFVTGDHGNAEEMFDGSKARPSHTDNKVPLVVLGLSDDEIKSGLVCVERCCVCDCCCCV